MRIFKYLNPERIDVIENKCIRFTQSNYLNDPFEYLPYISKLMNELDATDLYNVNIEPIFKQEGSRKLPKDLIPEEFHDKIPQDIMDEISKLTINDGLNLIPSFHPKKLLKKLLTTSSVDAKVNFSSILKENWNNKFGVLSLTQTYDNLTMWSHYSQNHEGFVIEFDPDNVFFRRQINTNDPLRRLKKVLYSNERPDIKLINLKRNKIDILESLVEQILFTKSIDWANEKEIRFILNLRDSDKKIESNGEIIHLFNFNPLAIKSIYLGVNSKENLLEKIKRILKEKEFSHINLFHGNLDLKDYRINFN